MMTLRENEVLEELPGGLKLIQNTTLYRFTSDSVLLSRFVRAKSGEVVADFCAGSGIVGLHFLALNPRLVRSLTLFELQASLSDLAARSIALNGLTNAQAVNCALQELGGAYHEAFSLILCNPPYEKGGFEHKSYEKAICRKEITVTLEEIVQIAAKKLKFGGRFALVNRADRAAEVLYRMKAANIEPKRLQFVSGKAGDRPYLLLAEGTKGGKEGIDVLPTLVNAKAESGGLPALENEETGHGGLPALGNGGEI